MEFAEIFTEMGWIPALLLCLGLVFLIVEVFIPGFGFFGITGIVSIIAGIVVRICDGLSLTQSLVLILLVLGFFIVAFVFMIYSAQYGILGRTGLFETHSSISKDYNEKGAPDIDSTPDNKKEGEDDIDDAPVMLSVKTGQAKVYYTLGLIVLVTIAGGIVLIKKFVL